MDATTQNNLAKKFAAMHDPKDPLVLVNAHDGGSAQTVADHKKAKAIASGSYAVAVTQGYSDDGLTLEGNVQGVKPIIAAGIKAGKPVSIDIQDGYGERLEECIEAIVALGAVGCNLEDFNRKTNSLYPIEEAAERVRRAKKAAAKKGVPDFVINARSDVLFSDGGHPFSEAVKRGKAFIDAGATTVFVWGGVGGRGTSSEEIKLLAKETNGRVSSMIMRGPGFLTVDQVRKLGIARISCGPALWVEAITAFNKGADEMLA